MPNYRDTYWRQLALACSIPLAIVGLSFALAISRQCPTEDSAWCLWLEPDYGHIALWMADPAPPIVRLY